MKKKRLRNLMLSSALVALGSLGSSNAAIATDQTYQFDIPAEPLGQALTDFSQTTSQSIILSEDLAKGKATSGLHGRYSSAEALNLLLAGTDLRVETNASGVLMVRPKNVRAAQNEGAANTNNEVETVVVTGTHIAGATPASPVFTISSEDIKRSGYSDAGSVMRSLPQSFSGGQQSTVVGAVGFNNYYNYAATDSANLRGFGSESTLVLVNGERIANSATSSSVDISGIPLSAVDHIDVLTDGASAVYGSDAIGGVVNFVLRKDFDGIQTTADLGTTTRGGAFTQRYAQMVGRDWDTGGVLLNYQYSNDQGLQSRTRKFSSALPTPNNLLPSLQEHAAYLYAHQDISSRLHAFIQGLYSNRQDLEMYNPRNLFTETIRPANAQLAVAGGGTYDLAGDWRLNATGSFGVSHEQDTLLYFGQLYKYNWTDKEFGGEVVVSGTITDTSAGPIKMAAGVGGRQEDFNQHNSTGFKTHGLHQNWYAYAELNLPLLGEERTYPWLQELSVDVAARYEHFNGFASSVNPKVGLVLRPDDEVRLRATWSRAFRAPNLLEQYEGTSTYLYRLPDPNLPSGSAVALIPALGNPGLKAETASPWTVGFDYSPDWLKGLTASSTYFETNYTNRILQPINILSTALTNPAYAPLVVINPTLAEQQQAIAEGAAGGFFNVTGTPYDPTTVNAIVDDRFLNVAAVYAHGIDLLLQYAHDLAKGTLGISVNGSWLTLTEQITPAAPKNTYSGTVFNAPRFKMRAESYWTDGEFQLAVFVNYVSSEKDPSTAPAMPISPWTTVDATVGYNAVDETDLLKGLSASLAVQNLFDINPPIIPASTTAGAGYPGLGYDSTNASPLGRVVKIQISKRF